MNRYKLIIKYLLFAFVVLSASYLIAKETGLIAKKDTTPAQNTAVVRSIPDGMVAYYFHGDRRCMTCKKIEEHYREALADAIQNGEIRWEVVNVETRGNDHFAYDFDLSSSSAVLATYKDGKLVNWKKLSDVWKLVRTKPDFINYIKNETAAFMGPNNG